MATSAANPLRDTGAAATFARAGVLVPLGVGLLAALSVLLRVGVINSGLWIDEGLSVGIADRPLLEIPGVLRQDGSPPLYYVLLHVWINGLGTRTEEALHALSLLFAIATIPVAYALLRSLVSPRAGWIGAALFATNPFLTLYAQEARMYALVVLLSLVTSAAFVGAFALRRSPRWTLAFALGQTALLYTHNWGLFLGAGLAAALAALLIVDHDRRGLLREAAIAGGVIAVAYAPWLPTLLFQAAHTGAPWGSVSDFGALVDAPRELLGFAGQFLLLVGVGAGLATLTRARSPEGRIALTLAIAGPTTLITAWLTTTIEPAFATRYTAVAVGPLLLLAAFGLSRAGRVGIAVLALVALLWAGTQPPSVKSNVRAVTRAVIPSLAPGDLVIATQPEQVPVLHYYLAGVEDLRYATLTGPVSDLGVTDWRDGVERLGATTTATDLDPLLDAAVPGQRIVLVRPFTDILARWKAPWTRLVRVRSAAWSLRMRDDPRFRVVSEQPVVPERQAHEVGAMVFVRRNAR